MSIKLSRIPRLHSRLLFRQLLHSGTPSSHLRWRSRQVKQPVRTRLDLPVAGLVEADDGFPLVLRGPPLLVLTGPVGADGRVVLREFAFLNGLAPTGGALGVPRRFEGGVSYRAPG